jgi:hypothetical protein
MSINKKTSVILVLYFVSLLGCSAPQNEPIAVNKSDGGTVTHSSTPVQTLIPTAQESPANTQTRSTWTPDKIINAPAPVQSPTVYPKTILYTSQLCSAKTRNSSNGYTSERIFLWESISRGYYFLTLENESAFKTFSKLEIDDTRVLADGFDWNKILALAFSNQSGKIALFLRNNDGIGELWISDIDLCNLEKVWVDTDGWVISSNIGLTPVTMIWGPSDNTVILSNNILINNIAIYRLENRDTYLINGECSKLLKVKELWSILCTNNENNKPSSYYLINSAGITRTVSIPLGEIRSISEEWAISSDGKKVIYVTNKKEVVVEDINGNQVKLDVSIDEDSNAILRARIYSRIFHWSKDNQQILIYAKPKSEQYCPKSISTIDNSKKNQSCWILIDPSTGSFTWWLRRDLTQKIARDWDGMSTKFQAALSPDGKRVILSIMNSSVRYLLISSVDNKSESNIIQYYSFALISWSGASR